MLFHKHLLINARVEKPMSSEEEAVSFLQKLVERIDIYVILKIKNKKNSEHTTLALYSVPYHS
jgi:hypothetical protein